MATCSTYKFKTYDLSKSEIQKLAYVAMREQGSTNGARAELSLMANLFELQSRYKTITDYVLKSGWFASNSTGSSTKDKKWTDLVVDVLIRGNRTLPPYVNEHDCYNPPDITSCTNDGVSFSPSDRGKYKQLTTVIKNRYGSTYRFWCFPAKGSDPFGTTQPKKLAKWLKEYGVKGELYYGSNSIEGVDLSDLDTTASAVSALQVHADQLYSSDNYWYIPIIEDEEKLTPYQKYLRKQRKTLKDILGKLFGKDDEENEVGAQAYNTLLLMSNVIKDVNVEMLTKIFKVTEPKVSDTMHKGSTSTSTLPVLGVAVEAPMFEVEIGGVKFGGYHNNRIPNYVKSLSVTKTNGSINDYTIQLIHQIRPGDNPNYIDNVLSVVKYNTIFIRYGDASTNQYYTDVGALITDVQQSFDFNNCNITYTINATSLVASTEATKYNYPEFTGKISDRIKELLWDETDSGLLNAYPGMANREEVEKEGLIPSDDKVVTVGSMQGLTAVEYLYALVSRMEKNFTGLGAESKEGVDTTYAVMTTDDTFANKFLIKEVIANLSEVPFMYEVNIGYPDDNFVLDFSVNDNQAWSLMYEGAKNIVRYDYELDSLGNLEIQRVPAYYYETEDELKLRNLWSSLTRFPVNATLTVRGLLKDSLLLQYIKINSIMYGAKRITSGVYIVTEQQDSIGNGVYSTRLNLTRVAGDDEYISVNARHRTESGSYTADSLKYIDIDTWEPPKPDEAEEGKNWAEGSTDFRERPMTK